MFWISPWVWILWAAWILLLPMKWLICAGIAAFVHEASHIISVILLGGRIRDISIGCFGIVIHAEGVTGYREVLCSLFGPLGSFLMALFIHRFPALGLCGLVQGAFNLIPIYPLDGGRALRCARSLYRQRNYP